MKDSIVIRNWRWDDFPQIVSRYYGFFKEVRHNPDLGIHLGPKKPSMAQEVEWFSRFYIDLLRGDAVASLAEVEGKVVGWAQVHKTDKRAELRHVGTFGICIIDGYRSQGIGTKLLKSLIKKSRGKFEIINLSVFAKNKAAIRLYEKCGFKKYGLEKRAIKRGRRYYDRYHMSLEL